MVSGFEPRKHGKSQPNADGLNQESCLAWPQCSSVIVGAEELEIRRNSS